MRRTVVGLAIAAVGLAGCGSSHAASSPSDRAACMELGAAYNAFVASHGGAPPSAAYRKALDTAKSATNTKLRNAITGWMDSMLGGTASRHPGPDAGYAETECKRIGAQLHFTSEKADSP